MSEEKLRFPLKEISRLAINTFAVLALSVPLATTAAYSQKNNLTDQPVNQELTAKIVQDIESVKTECGRYATMYRLDCLLQGIQQAGRDVPYHGQYGQMRSAIQASATEIRSLMLAHSDRSINRQDSGLNANPQFPARRYYAAIKASDIQSSNDAATKILNNLEGDLGKMTDPATDISPFYKPIGAAFRSTADLLKAP